VVFIETPIFTQLVKAVLTDEAYGQFQRWLAANPDAGAVIKGGKGIRKVRWALPGGGKSGGIRVIYFWRSKESQVYLLYLFEKGERSDLTPAQVKQLAKHAEALK
jgi:hypothetical protein